MHCSLHQVGDLASFLDYVYRYNLPSFLLQHTGRHAKGRTFQPLLFLNVNNVKNSNYANFLFMKSAFFFFTFFSL